MRDVGRIVFILATRVSRTRSKMLFVLVIRKDVRSKPHEFVHTFVLVGLFYCSIHGGLLSDMPLTDRLVFINFMCRLYI